MRARAAGVLLAMAPALTGCSRDIAGRGERARPIEMLVVTDAETLDPRYATDAVALRTTRLVHAGLVRLDETTLAPMPYLARGWTWMDPETLRVELRDDVRFHSGARFTSRDVVATLHAFADASVASRHARVVDAISSVTAESDHAVRIHLARPHATLLTDLELPILREDEAAGPPRPDGTLDGLGPFAVEERTPGEITLSPAAGSAMPLPRHAVVIRTVHDENARALRMHAQRADLVVNGLSPTLLPSLEKVQGVSIVGRPGANLTYMLARTDQGWLASAHVRRALAMAIDRHTIATTLFAGHAQVASTLLPPSHWAHTDEPPLPWSPAKAREELAEAHAGRLHLTLLTSTDRLRGTIARVIAQELSDVGVDVDVVPLELGTLLARLSAGDFELATLQLPEFTEPNVLRVFLHSSSIPPAGANRARIRDPEVDRLLDDGDRTLSPDMRKQIYAELERRVRDQAWILPLWHEDQIAVMNPRAQGFVPSAEGRWLSLATLP
ncbi:MAG: ABC transporter substrate-binding protein [Polyangiaceae bacterium]|nr:ABC transporter substrate-binding protein [Polyangiaceae bacterium]